MKKLGANSFRTSHCSYSEEMMQLCDREKVIVTEETIAVGIFHQLTASLDAKFNPEEAKKFELMDTTAAYHQVSTELIAQDKNHIYVVIWLIANETANHAPGAEPLMELACELNSQKRPLTLINILFSTSEYNRCTDLLM